MSSPPEVTPMTTSPASPISVSSGASYLVCIRLTPFLFWFPSSYKSDPSRGSARFGGEPAILAAAQPHFEQDDLPQLGLIAVQPGSHPLKPRAKACWVHESSLH